MDWESKARDALKRIKKLEEEVSALKSRMDREHDANQELIKRIGKLERA
jgi:phage shock protein A